MKAVEGNVGRTLVGLWSEVIGVVIRKHIKQQNLVDFHCTDLASLCETQLWSPIHEKDVKIVSSPGRDEGIWSMGRLDVL
jgi:hypothetical protein